MNLSGFLHIARLYAWCVMCKSSEGFVNKNGYDGQMRFCEILIQDSFRWIFFIVMGPWALFQCKDCLWSYVIPIINIRLVRLSFLYNGNPCAGNTDNVFILIRGPAGSETHYIVFAMGILVLVRLCLYWIRAQEVKLAVWRWLLHAPQQKQE